MPPANRSRQIPVLQVPLAPAPHRRPDPIAAVATPTPPAPTPRARAPAPSSSEDEREAHVAAQARLFQQRAFFREQVSPEAEAEARGVQDCARRLQAACNARGGKVHVLYESDGALGVLFSPTLAFDGPTGVQGGARLASALRAVAKTAVVPTMPKGSGSAAQAALADAYEGETLDWYPGEKHCSEGGAPWLTENLAVKPETMHKFHHLNRKETERIYQRLFGRMYTIMKPRMLGEKGPLRYCRFTPPWLRKNVKIGSRTLILDSDSMPELRYQRNRMGEKRLKAVLAAFYEREALARVILQELLGSRPATPGTLALQGGL